ncbi:TetR/AcrR family transcriptional regulator [Pseudoclavibacter terrae]|uniref:TetR/AcrR family transcriptional regulator n=1 Tax=Pseudoclavibacter terrae TaxID=1530195 RepID=UPI00232D3F2A|nr:TetR/AcrR family transcriptional regulator [Pseudoclavibacter terrae]
MAQQGRPRVFDEQHVLDAAMRVFWRHGYEASTVAELRSVTGLSAASLYGAFGSKEGLFERAVEHYIAGPGRVSELVGDITLDPLVAVDRMLHATIEMQSDPAHPGGCLVTLAATVGAEGDAPARAVVTERRVLDRARIADCLRRGITDGVMRSDLDPDVAALLVHSFMLGVSTQILDGVRPAELHRAADLVVEGLRSPQLSTTTDSRP